jgi:hypothetical protein
MERSFSTAICKRPPSRSCRRLPLTGKLWSCASNGLLTWDLAGRPLRLRGDSLRPGPCPLYAGDSWR